jgi:hypothetical protein
VGIASLHHQTSAPVAHRIERRNRKRTLQAAAGTAARTVAWTAGFLALVWLVAAGFYGLLGNA